MKEQKWNGIARKFEGKKGRGRNGKKKKEIGRNKKGRNRNEMEKQENWKGRKGEREGMERRKKK